jgi:hypothetical protein
VQVLRDALVCNPTDRKARRELGQLLVQLGRREESLPLWRAEFNDTHGWTWMRALLSEALCATDLRLAGDYAGMMAELRFGRPLSLGGEDSAYDAPGPHAPVHLTPDKVRHDLETSWSDTGCWIGSVWPCCTALLPLRNA